MSESPGPFGLIVTLEPKEQFDAAVKMITEALPPITAGAPDEWTVEALGVALSFITFGGGLGAWHPRFDVVQAVSSRHPWAGYNSAGLVGMVFHVEVPDRDSVYSPLSILRAPPGLIGVQVSIYFPAVPRDVAGLVKMLRRKVLEFAIHETDDCFLVAGLRPFEPRHG